MGRVLTYLGTHAFSVHAPWSWNNLQIDLNLDTFMSIDEFKGVIRNVVKGGMLLFVLKVLCGV